MIKHLSIRIAAPLLLALVGGLSGGAAQAQDIQWRVGVNLPVMQTVVSYGAPARMVVAQQPPAVVYAPAMRQPYPAQAYPTQAYYPQPVVQQPQVVYAQAPMMVSGYPMRGGHHHHHHQQWQGGDQGGWERGGWNRGDGHRGHGY